LRQIFWLSKKGLANDLAREFGQHDSAGCVRVLPVPFPETDVKVRQSAFFVLVRRADCKFIAPWFSGTELAK
jgi:hypothetical protein